MATLLDLLILASPQIKFMVLKIIQQLVRVKQISHKIFDQAVEIITSKSKNQSSEVAQPNQNMTEAQIIYNSI